jgi:hypothetical protein
MHDSGALVAVILFGPTAVLGIAILRMQLTVRKKLDRILALLQNGDEHRPDAIDLGYKNRS